MNSRKQLKEQTYKELIDSVSLSMADWSTDDVRYLLLQCEMELQYRIDTGELDDEN